MPRPSEWVVPSKEIGCNALQIFQSLCDFLSGAPSAWNVLSLLGRPIYPSCQFNYASLWNLRQFSKAKLCFLSYIISFIFCKSLPDGLTFNCFLLSHPHPLEAGQYFFFSLIFIKYSSNAGKKTKQAKTETKQKQKKWELIQGTPDTKI